MDSRTLDIAAFLAALCIVITIAFLVNPSPGGDEISEVSATGPEVSGDSVSPGAASGETLIQYQLPSYVTKDERKWLISRQVLEGMDYYLPVTRDYAVRYVTEEHSGTYSIEQACDVWDGSVSEWTYIPGSGGLLDISPASRSINKGLSGDEADYAVFLASMIKGVGGEARIKSAADPGREEYPYTELYLGNSADLQVKIVNSEKLSQFKSDYSPIFAKDPSGLTIFKYRYGRICNGDQCYDFVTPFFEILNEPEKYGEICYNYPKLIEYLLLFPDTNAVEFQALYIQVRYGGYDERYHELRNIRDLEYSYDLEDNGEVTYWLSMDLSGSYPGDPPVVRDVGSATAYYSDGSYKSIRVNKKIAPVVE